VLADIVARLLADHVHNGHRLNATEALLDPARRERALALLEELGRASALASYPSLTAFLADHHGIGGLFDPVTPEINTDSFGRSRKQVFEIEARRRDPVRAVGPTPDSAELTLLDEYGVRLRLRVLPAALREITELSAALGDGVRVSARAKRAADLLDKVRRMTTDRPRRPGRPDYRIGDVIDAVGVRLTVPDMPTLELALDRIRSHFGVGDGGRILEIENMYAEPKSQAPAYRVIPIIVAIETDGHPCTFELQLTTERASLAADVEHNTIYKPYVATDAAQRIVVERIMEEAAALDQLEIVDRNDHE